MSRKKETKLFHTATWLEESVRLALEQVAKNQDRSVAKQVRRYVMLGLQADGAYPKNEEMQHGQ